MGSADKPLRNQRAIITGASSGIGAAIATAFGAAGARVVVNYRSEEDEAERIAQEIRDAGSEAVAVQADVSDEEAVLRMFATAREAFGGLDILVSNAGIQKDAALTEMSLDDWNAVLGVNLTGQFLCVREAAREFLRGGEGGDRSKAIGKIICMSSVHQKVPWAGHVNYAAAKGGVGMFVESAAQELARHKIRVNAIAPGAIRTPINEEAWKDPKERKKLENLIPYGRIGEPEDVARLAVWLASDMSDYITGETIYIDGGMKLYPSFESGEG